jgi:dienelactone hydrolase
MRRWPLALLCVAGCAAVRPATPVAQGSRATSTTVGSTTAAATTPTTRRQSRPFPITSLQIGLVDATRPTVSHGRVISHGRSLPTTLWHPAEPGRWPLVVFGHGYEVGPGPYVGLCQAWAEAGYTVAAPTFPLATGPYADEADLQEEPADLSFVITSLLGAPYVDPTRVAVAGHSDGGEAAFAAGFQAGVADPRVRAVIALSAQPLTGSVVQPAMARPVLFGQGDADTVNPLSRGLAAYQQAPAPRFLLVLHGAGHLAPFSGQAPWAAVVDRVTIDFLDRYVAGLAAPLEPDGTVAGISTLYSHS